MNIYKIALKQAYRFSTEKGLLAGEDLLKLPSNQKTLLFLDGIARKLDEDYSSSKKKSFIGIKEKKDKDLKYKLDIIVDIIEDVQQELRIIAVQQDNNVESQKLLEARASIERKQYDELSIEEIDKRLKKLD